MLHKLIDFILSVSERDTHVFLFCFCLNNVFFIVTLIIVYCIIRFYMLCLMRVFVFFNYVCVCVLFFFFMI